MYGIHGNALKWFSSYLSKRTQSVVINDKESSKKPLKHGVPQGSKLGPILFNSYIAPLSNIAAKHDISDEKYADDEQLILAFKPNTPLNQRNSVCKMERCIQDIREFLLDNKLCNNSEKTEFMIIGCPSQLSKVQINSIQVENTSITPTGKVKNLGVVFDKTMTMEPQINHMCKKVFLNVKNIGMIRKCLNREDAKTAVHALVTPHLDYGNALLYGINQKHLRKLQVAQNSAARLIEKLQQKHDSITHVRKKLHWLPISARIEFKILSMTWKALNDESPSYISQLLCKQPQQRINVRSNNRNRLAQPQPKNKFGARAFSVIAPKLWNKLPEKIKSSSSSDSFKRALKTHLFKISYEQ